MTTREEIKAKIDALSDASFEEVVKVIERQAYVEQQMAALTAFAEDWTPEEQAAWDEGTKRRPWRTTPAEDAS
ncbi:hypothetical protein [Deinococcus frigens]|uniref:hypothetical protein n=1 Tax=Deinococcus frigens TaxID=249403 RepID=UPI000496172D|nr:hypothetical protein [Deinococcus frigens]